MPFTAENKPLFLNFTPDHTALLLTPKMYNVYYLIFRIIFGAELVYTVPETGDTESGDRSMTFAINIGTSGANEAVELRNTLLAVIQPSEAADKPSHVRSMLAEHNAEALWQHFALRVPDLFAFHNYAVKRGVNFITPILEGEKKDLFQVFSGELFSPSSQRSALFFEFIQRELTLEMRKRLAEHNRETFFRDKTFLGLYDEKEAEYQSDNVTPFIDHKLFEKLYDMVGHLQLWDITEEMVDVAEQCMLDYTKTKKAFSHKRFQ